MTKKKIKKNVPFKNYSNKQSFYIPENFNVGEEESIKK